MHGVDWEKVRKNYEPLIPFVRHRADLTYIIGEMIGELSAGHTYVGGGDLPQKAADQDGTCSGRWSKRMPRPDISGFVKILKGQNWDKRRPVAAD